MIYHETDHGVLYCGCCLEVMKQLPDESVDSVVTDPPYGLGFMGKAWDTFDKSQFGKAGEEGENDLKVKKNFNILPRYNTDGLYEFTLDWAVECLRILKPGGHLLSFAGTRTYHRIACAIEDAGFEVKNMTAWLYGSGFPKSLNLSLNINKSIDKIMGVINNAPLGDVICNMKLNDANIVESQSEKNLTEIGTLMQKNAFAVESVVGKVRVQNWSVPVNTVELFFAEAHLTQGISAYIVLQNADILQKQSQSHVKYVAKWLQSQYHSQDINIFIVECDVRELLKESIMDKHRGDEALKIWLGNLLSSKETDINANYVELIENLKHIIFKELNTTLNSDTTLTMELPTATPVIITQSTRECLITSMEDILKKIAQLWEGWGTALKPALEPICVARKPISEANIAANVLKHGTGGINIDGCRVETTDITGRALYDNPSWTNSSIKGQGSINDDWKKGRFPANVIHDGSDEVMALFPDTGKSSGGRIGNKGSALNMCGTEYERGDPGYSDSGSAARFFYCAKASPAERNAGCENLPLVKYNTNILPKEGSIAKYGYDDACDRMKKKCSNHNHHPTVKPIDLMAYLCRLVTRKGGTVLEPFSGSGTTAIACIREGFRYIAIERESDYCEIAARRISKELEQTRIEL